MTLLLKVKMICLYILLKSTLIPQSYSGYAFLIFESEVAYNKPYYIANGEMSKISSTTTGMNRQYKCHSHAISCSTYNNVTVECF